MSRKTEKQTTSYESDVVVEVKCDLCGKIAPSRYPTDWSEGSYEVSETEVRFKSGERYPESGHGDEIEYDICSQCFTEKLMPWMESQGASPRKTEWDF